VIRGLIITAVVVPALVLVACGSSSSGPGTGRAGEVVVPNVVGAHMGAAARALACAGLRPYPQKVTTTGTAPIAAPVLTDPPVTSMQPAAGMSVPRGSTVSVRYLSPPSSLVAVKASCPR
jgi:hypothetical protein